MKKTLAFIVSVALIICLSGCSRSEGPEETEYDETCEAQNKYTWSGGLCFQEVGNSYIGSVMGGDKILYYDSESGVSGVLCSDPSCTHDTNTCSARIQKGSAFYYDHQIYSISHDSENNSGDYILWKEDVSGNNRKKVKAISRTDIVFEYQPQQYFLHHGKLYILGKANTIEGARPEWRISLLSTPIDSSSEYQILVDKRVNTYVQTGARFVGDHVYYMIFEWFDNGPLSLTIMRFSTTDGKEEIVYKKTEISEGINDFWVTDSEEIYISGRDVDDRACVWKINGNRWETAVTLDNDSDATARLLDGAVVFIYMVEGTRYISIKNFENEMLYEGPLFKKSPEGVKEDLRGKISFAVVGGDREKVIVDVDTDTRKKSYTILLDINNDLEPTLLWSD